MLEEQLCWQVGTGHYIEVWRDGWIPENPKSMLVATNPIGINANMLVAELIMNIRWNLDMICNAIDPSDVTHILDIP